MTRKPSAACERLRDHLREIYNFRVSDLSDRALAELCGVGHPFVAKVRATQVELDSTSTPAPEAPKTRKGKDGKEYPAPEPLPGSVCTEF